MKTSFKYLLFFFTAGLIGLSSCDNDDDDGKVVVEEGLPTKMKLSIAQAGSFTRDANANNDETTFKTVDVFIYNANTNSLEQTNRLLSTDFTEETTGSGIYVGNATITARTGVKNIYIGVNLPTTLFEQISAAGPMAARSIAAITDLTSTVNGFVMFSESAVNTTLTENVEDPGNSINAKVKRLVAKVAMQEGSSLNTVASGGVLSNLSFAIRNMNTKFFPAQVNDGGIIKDPNWAIEGDGVILNRDFLQMTDYMRVDLASVSDNKLLKPKYALENSSQDQFADELTYVSIRAEFVPNFLLKYTDGSSSAGGFTSEPNEGKPVAAFFRLVTPGGESHYSASSAVLNSYATEELGIPAGSVRILNYVDGFCYYNLFLNEGKKYSIFRNDFYKTTVTAINGIGNPNNDDNIIHEKLESSAAIDVTVVVLDWNIIDVDGQLPGS